MLLGMVTNKSKISVVSQTQLCFSPILGARWIFNPATLLGCFPSSGDSGIQVPSMFWCHCLQHRGIKSNMGREMIMVTAQLLIIHLSLEVTLHFCSPSISHTSPRASFRGEVAQKSSSYLGKGFLRVTLKSRSGAWSPVLASYNLLHFSTFIWLQQFSVMIAFTLPMGN